MLRFPSALGGDQMRTVLAWLMLMLMAKNVKDRWAIG